MKKSLAHLPPRKRKELSHIVSRIRERVADIQMIILFGSKELDTVGAGLCYTDFFGDSFDSDF